MLERVAKAGWIASAALAAAYLLLFVIHLPQLIGAVYWESDYSSPYVIAETIARSGTGGHTVLSTYGDYVILWFTLLTSWLPAHRELWEISQPALMVTTAVLIGLGVTRLTTRRAGLLAAGIAFVVSPTAMAFMLGPTRDPTYFASAVLGLWVLWLASERATWWRIATAGCALAVLLGVSISSDGIALLAAGAPLAATALAATICRTPQRWKMAAGSIGVFVGAVPVAFAVSALMHSAGYRTLPPRRSLASLSVLDSHASILWGGLRHLFNGYLGGPLGALSDIVVVVALSGLCVVTVRALIGLRTRPQLAAKHLWTVYWFCAAAAVCAGFISTTRAASGHESYYATVLFAAAAVLPLESDGHRITRALVPLAAAVYLAGALLGLHRGYLYKIAPPVTPYAGRAVALARASGATVGYADYWDASNLTWGSHEQVVVRPVVLCGGLICRFFLNTVPSWYAARPRKSFLLVDTAAPYLYAVPVELGRPLASYTVGGPITMYVYSYDIASRLG